MKHIKTNISLIVVVPCYNEGNRLNNDSYINYFHNSSHKLLFINDGSTDDTKQVIESICKVLSNARAIHLDQNMGKAAAVRHGILYAFENMEAELFAFWDADLATPLITIDSFVRHYLRSDAEIILGCRVRRLGSNIQRSTIRHILGRIFATLASISLRLPIYDTQCGAKLFHKSHINDIFKNAFKSNWLFDIEIIFRLKARLGKNLYSLVYELPLESWQDKEGSKLRKLDFIKAPFELIKLYWNYNNGPKRG